MNFLSITCPYQFIITVIVINIIIHQTPSKALNLLNIHLIDSAATTHLIIPSSHVCEEALEQLSNNTQSALIQGTIKYVKRKGKFN